VHAGKSTTPEKLKREENKGWVARDVWAKKEIGIQIKYIFKFKEV
jgi:hypothetical protein